MSQRNGFGVKKLIMSETKTSGDGLRQELNMIQDDIVKVRVFLPTDEALEPFAYGEFEFDTMPLEGQILRFADFDGVDYPVEQVGYIQVERAFIGAVWLGPPRPYVNHSFETAEPKESALPVDAVHDTDKTRSSPRL